MGADQLKSLKNEIEEYRGLLEKELNAEKSSNKMKSIIKLSRDLDNLIVKYEQTLRSFKQNPRGICL